MVDIILYSLYYYFISKKGYLIMYKPLSTDPKCSFSISLPVSLRKIIDVHLRGKSRSEFIKEALLFWFRENSDKLT